VYDEARAVADSNGEDISAARATELVEMLVQKHRLALGPTRRSKVACTTLTLAERLVELARANRNGIWAFILRNTYRPGLLVGQFNGLVSHPPWLAMSQLADNPYEVQLSRDGRGARAGCSVVAPPGCGVHGPRCQYNR
jgi:hypothetical protein